MLNRVSDLWPFAHLLVTLAMYAALFIAPWWVVPLALPITTLFAGAVVAIAHNHAHVPMFRIGILNWLVDITIQQLTGFLSLGWKVHHVRSHHQFPWTERDYSSPYSFQETRRPEGPVSLTYYWATYLPLFWCESVTHLLRRAKRSELMQLTLSLAVFLGIHLALIDRFGPIHWILIVLPTYIFCGRALGLINYFQHWACEDHNAPEAPFLAWTFTCPVHNIATFNAGYHMLHHLRPSLHWSDLPRVHRDDSSYTLPELIEEGRFPGLRPAKAMQSWLKEKSQRIGKIEREEHIGS